MKDVTNLLFFILLEFMPCKAEQVAMRHGVTRKKSTTKLKHSGNLFKKNLQLKVTPSPDLKPLRS